MLVKITAVYEIDNIQSEIAEESHNELHSDIVSWVRGSIQPH